MSLDLWLERDRYAPGERVSGRVTVRAEGLQEIQVGLLFREEAPQREATVSQVLAEGLDGARDLREGDTIEFEVELPADAAPNVETTHGGLVWEVVARTDRVGGEQVASRRITVAPR